MLLSERLQRHRFLAFWLRKDCFHLVQTHQERSYWQDKEVLKQEAPVEDPEEDCVLFLLFAVFAVPGVCRSCSLALVFLPLVLLPLVWCHLPVVLDFWFLCSWSWSWCSVRLADCVCINSCVGWFIPNWGQPLVNFSTFFFCVCEYQNMPIYESKRAVICSITTLALSTAPTLAGILDDTELQLGAEVMKTHVVNIMQNSSKSFISHLANSDQVDAFMARGLTFRGHLLDVVQAKNTTTFMLDSVPYGLPEASIKTTLARYGEIKPM